MPASHPTIKEATDDLEAALRDFQTVARSAQGDYAEGLKRLEDAHVRFRAAFIASQATEAAIEPAMKALRAWRAGVAKVKQLPPYVIATDAVLRAIASAYVLNPITFGVAELRKVRGMTEHKVDTYGSAILQALSKAVA